MVSQAMVDYDVYYHIEIVNNRYRLQNLTWQHLDCLKFDMATFGLTYMTGAGKILCLQHGT